jgi:hypothetical protein
VAAAVLLLGLADGRLAPARAAGFVVDTSMDDTNAHDVSPGDCVCSDTFGKCTLRAALEEANACSGADTITFQSAMNIYVDAGEGALPPVTETVTIDASSVWDSTNDAPGVMISGGGGSYIGLFLDAGLCQVYGLYVTNFDGPGLYVTSGSNTIGGTGAGQRNVFSGNATGITLSGSSATSNVIRNNYLGLTPAGDTMNPNDTGLNLSSGASNNTVGGTEAAQANFISGNTSYGVSIESSGTDGNLFQGNVIGVAADRSTQLGNGLHGVRILDGPASTGIGGASGAGNIIVYNGGEGVNVYNAGTFTDVSYNLLASNQGDGVRVTDTAGCAVVYNIISGNGQNGVRVVGASSTGNMIWYNSIFNNNWKGIALESGGNGSIAAPVISSASGSGASGTACSSCWILVYSDASDEGQVSHGMTKADGAGNWSYSGTLSGPNVTATASDSIDNTSEFSAPYDILREVYLPLVQR